MSAKHQRCRLHEVPQRVILSCLGPLLLADEMAYLHQTSKTMQQATETDQEAAMQNFHHIQCGYGRRGRLWPTLVQRWPDMQYRVLWFQTFLGGQGLWFFLSLRGVDETCVMLRYMFVDAHMDRPVEPGPLRFSLRAYLRNRKSKRNRPKTTDLSHVQCWLMDLALGESYDETTFLDMTQWARLYVHE